MNTVTINGTELNLFSAQSRFAGYGHQKITVTLELNNERKDFSSTTNNMPAFDEAQELEGAEKELALFNIVEHKIQDQIAEWIEEFETAE
jgi:hypothetical protein